VNPLNLVMVAPILLVGPHTKSSGVHEVLAVQGIL